MALETLDWIIIGAFFALSLAIGIYAARKAGRDSEQFFLSGRSMPWWLLGISMVATTFSTDTPNLVTDIVRQNGVSGNWVWWAFLLTGMLTVFIYARLWRRSGVFTDLEFYELRYSGRPAAILRGFRALYLGLFFNVLTMASVCVAAIKIGSVMFGFSPIQTILIAAVITVVYSALGGLRGVILTDFVQFAIAMTGSVLAARYMVSLPEVGGLDGLLTHENVKDRLSLLPDFNDKGMVLTVLIIPLAVQWWSVWYPGAEPGGGGYVAQRMLAAKNETHSLGATLLFNVAFIGLRPWPWIIVALASLVVFPDLASIQERFPGLDEGKLGHDVAYPAMMTLLPAGLLGLVAASLIAAFMSTVSTQLNWGSSYIVNDFWKRFVRPDASERQLVHVGRISTVVLMVLGGLFALQLQNALQAFDILLQVGAGTGLIFILRWFWWRINAWAEITAMVVSLAIALLFFYLKKAGVAGFAIVWADGVGETIPIDQIKLVFGVLVTSFVSIFVALATSPADTETLREFYRKTRPGGPGWRRVVEEARRDGETLDDPDAAWQVPKGILGMLLGCGAVYSALFATGMWIYGNTMPALILTVAAIVCTAVLIVMWRSISGSDDRRTT